MAIMSRIYAILAFQLACTDPLFVSTSTAPMQSLGGDEYVTLSAGNNNDLAWGFGQAGLLHLTPHASGSTVTGLDSTYVNNYGVLHLRNESATVPIVFTHLDTSSSSGNRVRDPESKSYILGPGRNAAAQWSLDSTGNVVGWQLWAWGEPTGYSSIGTTARSLGSAFTPSTTRPVLGHWSVRVTCGGMLSCAGRIELLSDGAGTPTTVRARCAAGASTIAVAVGSLGECAITWLANPGDQVLLQLVTESGTPSGAVTTVAEQVMN
jgi:hypothetical protein